MATNSFGNIVYICCLEDKDKSLIQNTFDYKHAKIQNVDNENLIYNLMKLYDTSYVIYQKIQED